MFDKFVKFVKFVEFVKFVKFVEFVKFDLTMQSYGKKRICASFLTYAEQEKALSNTADFLYVTNFNVQETYAAPFL